LVHRWLCFVDSTTAHFALADSEILGAKQMKARAKWFVGASSLDASDL
jgi:hypothetical protein